MRRLWHTVVLAGCVALLTPASAQQNQQDATPLSAIRILSPKPGEKITHSFVQVIYEVTGPVGGETDPTFELRLDTRDPVRLRDTEHTFTGLAPGTHTLMIQVVDANETPVPGTRLQIEFVVVQPKSRDEESRKKPYIAAADGPRLLLAGAGPTSGLNQLPQASSALPLLSLVGFGVLLGGLAASNRSR